MHFSVKFTEIHNYKRAIFIFLYVKCNLNMKQIAVLTSSNMPAGLYFLHFYRSHRSVLPTPLV